nr:unnamed protein product [Digitaria exilis]
MEAFAVSPHGRQALRFLCPKRSLLSPPSASPLRWLIGAPRVLPPFTVAAALRPLHGDHAAPDLPREAGNEGSDADAARALELARALRERLLGVAASHGMVGGCMDASSGEIRFVASGSGGRDAAEGLEVVWEDDPGTLLWEKGCLLRCELPLKLPLYVPADEISGIEERFSSLVESTAAKLRNPIVSFLVEGPVTSDESRHSIILHGSDLCSDSHIPGKSRTKECTASCSEFFREKRHNLLLTGESADAIEITILSNQSVGGTTPVIDYFPEVYLSISVLVLVNILFLFSAPAPVSLRVINLKLDILCYSSIDSPVGVAISELVIPGLTDQMSVMKKIIASEITQQAQVLHCFEMSTEEFHLVVVSVCSISYLSGGIMSLIDGSYEYYHYLHDGIDDNVMSCSRILFLPMFQGWGCAYRSLQTIMSWYRLQQYSSIDVPSHREIQQVLVEIGDKDPSFIGSREWIGAIELSFVLDKLLGASCKIINVRSGDELPEKCRELARHFETQGTPVMIGGGVLAYTLLGVDYNEASGDCAFLILDPHYTGSDDIKKIVNGGWCGWKKSVDSKGRSFFLKDKFYNLLLPQRPNMV